MKLLLLSAALLLAVPVSSRADDYVQGADGFFYLNGVAYTRTFVNGYYYIERGCRYWYPGSYSYTKVVKTAATNPNDWRQEIAKAARERLEHQNFLESLRFAGLNAPAQPNVLGGYGSSHSIGTYGAQGNTVYGYSLNSIADLYGSTDLNALYLQAARLVQGAQSLAGQGSADFAGLVNAEGANRARVAEIIAKGQAAEKALQALNGPPVKVEQKTQFTFRIGADGKPVIEESDPVVAPRVDVFKTWNGQAQVCAQCHFGDKAALKGGFDISSWPSLPMSKKLEYVQTRLLSKDPAKIMPPPGKGPSLKESDVIDYWLKVQPAKP